IDVKGPAKDIFRGAGSYSNGGAMKIAPVSLFSYNNYDNLLHYVKEVTQITHAHELGINGATLQVITNSFVQPYKERLKIVKNLLSETGGELNEQRIIEELGNKLTALESVPTAIFCFLNAEKRIKGIRTDNPVRRAIQYAITLGGDTDTIASMTGAIAGAFYGHEKFNRLLLSHCEQADRFEELADALLDVAISKT
ncbi:Poly(ADP-ribose) glycohydrolase ARH3, partial [Camponotus floridanus]